MLPPGDASSVLEQKTVSRSISAGYQQKGKASFFFGLGRMADSNNLEEILKPFYQRAFEAEDRLAKLEAAVDTKTNSGNEELVKMVDDLHSKLEAIKAEKAAETEQVQKKLQLLNAENAKLQYRITHLVRALKEADCKLMSR